MTLSNNQKEIIYAMRDGTGFYYNSATQRTKYTKREVGGGVSNAINGKTMNSLHRLGLVERIMKKPTLYKFELTELGKNYTL